MSYRFRKKESIECSVRRVAGEQIDRGVAELASERLTRAASVHQVRKRCKKLRGLLRLVRPALGEAYTAENEWFRDTARLLSQDRDAKTRQDTYDTLLTHFSDQVRRSTFGSIRRRLTLQRKELVEDRDRQPCQTARQRLLEARQRIEDWPLSDIGCGDISEGLLRTYGRACDAMDAAREEPTADAFHEWRKRVKYHWYHCRLLRNVWRAMMMFRIAAADHLGDLLGQDHDLAVLREHIAAEPGEFGDSRDVEAFFGLIAQRRRYLQRRSFRQGARLFAEQPEALATRIEACWNIWQTD